MLVAQKETNRTEAYNLGLGSEARHERWAHCHVNWTAIAVGALASLAVALVIGLIGIALGAHLLRPEDRIVDMRKLGIGALIFSVCGAFFSAAAGGWVASKIAGILHSEPAMIHGAIVWLVTIPMLLVATAVGAGSAMGGWYAGLNPNATTSANAPFTRPDALSASATPEQVAAYNTRQDEYNRNVKQWQDDTPRVTRNSALGAITALLIALAGSVIGAWVACGEPMNFSHHRTRKPMYHTP